MKKNKILEKQTEFINNILKKDISSSVYLTDIKKAISQSIQKFVDIAFKPSFKYKNSYIFNKEEQIEEINNILLDLNIINDSITNINDGISERYNDIQDFKTKSKNELNKLKSYINQIDFLNGSNNTENFINSFEDYSQIDKDLTNLEKTNIMTSEGILTLPTKSSLERNFSEKNIKILTNGEIGNFGIIEKNTLIDENTINDEAQLYYYLSDINSHSKKENLKSDITDWLEIQNLDGYLNVDLVINFTSSVKINWINIIPYIPKESKGTFTVKSIKYKNSSNQLKSVFNEEIINKKIGLSFSTNNKNKYYEQGVFSFPTIDTDTIIISLEQTDAYSVKTGTYKYYTKLNETFVEVKEHDVPTNVKDGSPGTYYIDQLFNREDSNGRVYQETITEIYKKEIVLDSIKDRYMIGIRSIDFNYNKYESDSEVYSILYSTNKNIDKIKLNTIEQIPDSLIGKDILKYYISIDDNIWYQIKPYNTLNKDKENVPTVYELNSNINDEIKTLNINTKYINKDSKNIRLKIEMNKSGDILEETPILEEYVLIVEEKEE